jgi:hypothetical protein
MRWLRNRTGQRHGQATLEMALVLPVLAMLTMGVIEMGLLLNAYINVVNLAREAARISLDGATNCEMRSVLTTQASGRLDLPNAGAVLIVRGKTNNSGVVPSSSSPWWIVDPSNPTTAGGRAISLVSQRTDFQGTNVANTSGVNFVLVEVHYLHQTITRLPFADAVMVSSRTFIRTNLDETANVHTPLVCS